VVLARTAGAAAPGTSPATLFRVWYEREVTGPTAVHATSHFTAVAEVRTTIPKYTTWSTTLLCFRRMSKGDPHNKVAFVKKQQSSYRGMHSLSLASCCTGLQYLAHRVSVFNAEGALLSRVGGVPGPDLGQLSLPSSVRIVGREAYIAVAESINARGESVL
jgi:hypothetical protein